MGKSPQSYVTNVIRLVTNVNTSTYAMTLRFSVTSLTSLTSLAPRAALRDPPNRALGLRGWTAATRPPTGSNRLHGAAARYRRCRACRWRGVGGYAGECRNRRPDVKSDPAAIFGQTTPVTLVTLVTLL
jgi:hypothetical protein